MVNPSADWSTRAGLQSVEINNDWQQLIAPLWNVTMPEAIKFDFDALVAKDASSNKTYILHFWGR